MQDTCPNCGCNLKQLRKRKLEEIEDTINTKYKSVLEFPRTRAKIVAGIGGFLLGFIISLFLGVIFVAITEYFGISDLGEGSIFEAKLWQVILRFIFALIMLVPPFFIASEFSKDATPIEEKKIRKELLQN